MNEFSASMDQNDRSLTAWEWIALGETFNLADGHSRGWVTPSHKNLLRDLPSLYEASIYANQRETQQEFARSFFRLSGQGSALTAGVPIFHYSSSMTVDAVSQALLRSGCVSVALVTPTFDNLSAILRRNSLSIVPVSELTVWDHVRRGELLQSVDALFVVLPNNPTGREPSSAEFESIAHQCELSNVSLIVDASFRFFGSINDWDMYSILGSHKDLKWYVIEDTGKTWGLAELKVGFAMCDFSSRAKLETVTDDMLLNVSPFILNLLTRVMSASKGADAYLESVRRVVHENRVRLRSSLHNKFPIYCADSESVVSVEWLRLDESIDSGKLCERLRQFGVVILPGGPFYWNDPVIGRNFARIALLRDPRYFSRAIEVLVRSLELLLT